MMSYFVYILASKRNGTLYVGSTSNLIKRIWQHKKSMLAGFTAKHRIIYLVYFESFQEISDMAQRERRLKEWQRSWKIALIEKGNPDWKDLFDTLF